MTSMHKHSENWLAFRNEQRENKLQWTKILLKDIEKHKISLLKSKQ